MRIGAGIGGTIGSVAAKSAGVRGKRFAESHSDTVGTGSESWLAAGGGMLQGLLLDDKKSVDQANQSSGEGTVSETTDDRSEAAKIYEAVKSGGKNPLEELITAPKVPYGYMAKDGVIIHNGVCFVCDEKTNSICLGNMADQRQVINIELSGGGHLKVNRENLEQLAKAMDMFSPEDVNLIMRAIHQDTKVQSMQKEIEDMEAGVGEQLASDGEESEEASVSLSEPEKEN